MTTAEIQLPEGVRRGNEKLIRLSESAARQIASLRERDSESGPYLRIKIVGGGCNGLSYDLKFTDKTKRGDIYVDSRDVGLIIDSKSALYLKGMELDYSDRLVAGGFVFNNPNAKSSCSCGESFSV